MTPSGLAEEHVLWRQVVREFVDRDVAPIAGELERRGEYPDALLPTLAELGLLGMSIPVEHGGSDLDMVSFAIAYEELARGWMGLASIVGSSSSGAWLISRHGTDEQRRRWLPDLAVGRRVSGLALTEPAAGSDLRSIQVSAARDGDTYRVRGAKTMITHARHADPIAVLVVTDPAAQPRHHGMSVLMVEAATPGYTVSRDISKLGHRGVELCELSFDDARVPAGNLLGGVAGMGFRQMMSALDRGRVYMAAASVGIARASYEAAARHAHEREAFGSPIADFQAVKLRIAAMTTRITAARLLTLDAARQVETRGRANSAAAMAKVFASEAAIDCSLDAMRILGGYGYTTEFPVERYFRDAPVMAIGEGANDILQLLIADESLKRREV